MIPAQILSALAPFLVHTQISPEQYLKVKEMLDPVPFRFVVRSPINRLADIYTMTLAYFYGGRWRDESIEIHVTNLNSWLDHFERLFSDVYINWINAGSPREAYSAHGSPWSNK